MECLICESHRITTSSSEAYMRCQDCQHEFSKTLGSGVVANSSLRTKPQSPNLLERGQVAALHRANWEGTPLIDVGCSQGGFLRAVREIDQLPCGSFGVELDEASRRAGIEWFNLSIVSSLPDDNAANFTTFWHSAEHFQISELRNTLRILSRSSTAILVSVPNSNSWVRRLTRSRWAFSDPSHYISQFSSQSLDTLLAQEGFVRKHRLRMISYEAFCCLQSLMNLLTPFNHLYERLKRGNGAEERLLLLKDIFAALVMLMPATFLTLVSLARPSFANCITHVYSPIRSE